MNVRDASVVFIVTIGASMGAAPSVSAAEVVVQNDSMTDASSVTPCVCFVPGDIPAAWLTAPTDGNIVAVQVFWKSQVGGGADLQEAAIRLYDGSSFPTPGAVLTNEGGAAAEIFTPTLSDGVLNEYRFLDLAQTVPLRVPVSAGQTFAVGLEIFNQSSGGGAFTPSLTYDNDGCQAGRNGVFVFDTNSWSDACTQGVTGDWVIRAVIDTTPTIPAVKPAGLVGVALIVVAAGAIVILRRRDMAVGGASGRT
ncbi:MAG: hypothetical protein D6788_05270 [Planctomycetota bacterium]|nr:MAG: hypothetical protein D6788_05270 [Planctomycetota bacterium]